jgi:hypothetical protein
MVQVECRPRKEGCGGETGLLARIRDRIAALNPLVEVAIFYGAYFLIKWVWLPGASAGGSAFWYSAGWAVGDFLIIWMMFISHAVRKRGFEYLGFASHRSFASKINKILKWGEKWNYFLIGGTVICAYAIFMYNFATFTDLIFALGPLNRFLIENIPHSAFTFLLATGQFIFFVVITALFFFKTDNIKPSVKEYAKYGTPYILFLFIWAVAMSQRAYTETFMNVATNFLGYIYWALAQQLPTLVYISPSAMEGLERSGLVKDPRRRQIISSLITASIFAGIHLPTMPLSLFAFVMEFIIAMIYSFDKYRNVFVACLFHAMVGVIVVFLM